MQEPQFGVLGRLGAANLIAGHLFVAAPLGAQAFLVLHEELALVVVRARPQQLLGFIRTDAALVGACVPHGRVVRVHLVRQQQWMRLREAVALAGYAHLLAVAVAVGHDGRLAVGHAVAGLPEVGHASAQSAVVGVIWK